MMQLSSENDHNSISNKILQYALQKPSIPDYISLVFSWPVLHGSAVCDNNNTAEQLT